MKKYYYKIDSIIEPIIILKAFNVFYGELAVIYKANQDTALAQVVAIKGHDIYLQVFGGTNGIRIDDRVEFKGTSHHLIFAPELLLGRIFNGSGKAIDNRPNIDQGERLDLLSPTINPTKRVLPQQIINTGIPMIDMFNTLVEGQSIAIFTNTKEPYNDLLAKIVLKANVDIVIFGGMGISYDDFLYFKNYFKTNRHNTIMFIHTPKDAAGECTLIPDLCLRVAEKYALLGKKVLVLLSDMASLADAHKEIAIAMDNIPSSRGYPSNLYVEFARHYEKAVLLDNLGSITLLSLATIPSDDLAHPIMHNIAQTTTTQLYLKNASIDPLLSISRSNHLISKNTREDHSYLIDILIRLYHEANQTRFQLSMGFKISSYHKKLIAYADDLEKNMMMLSLNLPLFEQLDLGWEILANHFAKETLDLPYKLIEKYWPSML